MDIHPEVTVGLSGGVDSSVAALLLHEQGYAVSAVFMKNWEEDDSSGVCPAAADYRDAQAVARALGVPFAAISFADLYWERVFTPFLAAYRAGYTPNPDISCNREIKFAAFLEYARDRGAEYIATGHYARIRHENGTYHLLKGCDATKDQSYFLYTLTQRELARVLFPVGELAKREVRRLAAQAGLVTQAKKDSTGICFIGERPFRDFLARYLPPQPGPLLTPDGIVVGEHEGAMYYTIGQRHGLRLGGRRGARDAPWYVAAKDPLKNSVIVVQGHDHPLLYSASLIATEISWVPGKAPELPFRCYAKTRYRQEDQKCVISVRDDGIEVRFDAPQWALTPGQAVVFYQGDECLGGGRINLPKD